MAHEFENGFFVVEPAWHRLGKVLDAPPSVDEALRLAGLDWQVIECPLTAELITTDGVAPIQVPGHKAIVRESDRTVLGVVKTAYKPVQNVEMLKTFEPIIADGTIKLDAAGSLQGGRKVWLLGRYGDSVEVKDGDKVLPYLLLATGHDGLMSVRMLNTPIRVVCWNTMSVAGAVDDNDANGTIKAVRGGISIPHIGDPAAKMEMARDAIVHANAQFLNAVTVYREMSNRGVDVQTVKTFAREVFDDDYVKARNLIERLRARVAEEEGEIQETLRKQMAELEALLTKPTRIETKLVETFESGPGHEQAGSTVWGLYNAATHHIDHERGKNPDQRLASAWFGPGAEKRAVAFDKAIALMQ